MIFEELALGDISRNLLSEEFRKRLWEMKFF